MLNIGVPWVVKTFHFDIFLLFVVPVHRIGNYLKCMNDGGAVEEYHNMLDTYYVVNCFHQSNNTSRVFPMIERELAHSMSYPSHHNSGMCWVRADYVHSRTGFFLQVTQVTRALADTTQHKMGKGKKH